MRDPLLKGRRFSVSSGYYMVPSRCIRAVYFGFGQLGFGGRKKGGRVLGMREERLFQYELSNTLLDSPDVLLGPHFDHMVERMVKEAERFAKEDKERRDAIDTKSQADSVVYQREKQIKELGDKLPGPVKEKVEANLGELKEAISGGSTQAMKDAMAALNQEVMQLGQSLYNQLGATPGGSTGPSDSPGKGPDGDVSDADFSDSK